MRFENKLKLLLSLSLCAVAHASAHKELGDVNWHRNYDKAATLSEETGKPLLILFQEVPGCQGCIDYGQQTLTHPLIVDAIESEFVPLAIKNNTAIGHDRQILKRFNEPAWNFQVMRFVDQDGNDLIPRRDRVWTPSGTAQRMILALEAAERPVPDYLRTLAWTQPSARLKEAAFTMFCFWDGEAKLGGIDGVTETEAGWLDGREVVRLRYDPNTITWPDLVEEAQSHGCANRVYAPDDRTLAQTPKALSSKTRIFDTKAYRRAKSSDQKRHLQFSRARELRLNPIQQTKINAAISSRDPNLVAKWLSPSQLKELM